MSESFAVQAKVYDRMVELEEFLTPKVPTTFADALKLAAQLEEQRQLALTQVAFMTPKAIFHDQVAEASGDPLAKFAKVVGIGRNKLFEMLRRDGYLQLNNFPYQKYIDQGLFEVKESTPWIDSKGKHHIAYQTLLTGKGQIYFTYK